MVLQVSESATASDFDDNENEPATYSVVERKWQRRFLDWLPVIRRYAEFRLRTVPVELREEMTQETIARAMVDYLRLFQRRKEHVVCATSLAKLALAQVRRGRRVGNRQNVRDVSSPHCHWRKGITLTSLDDHRNNSAEWKEVLLENKRSGPDETAAARIDIAEWLTTLPGRHRQLAELLASGNTTTEAAQLVGVSPGRVSQLRRELNLAWHDFQGESDCLDAV